MMVYRCNMLIDGDDTFQAMMAVSITLVALLVLLNSSGIQSQNNGKVNRDSLWNVNIIILDETRSFCQDSIYGILSAVYNIYLHFPPLRIQIMCIDLIRRFLVLCVFGLFYFSLFIFCSTSDGTLCKYPVSFLLLILMLNCSDCKLY